MILLKVGDGVDKASGKIIKEKKTTNKLIPGPGESDEKTGSEVEEVSEDVYSSYAGFTITPEDIDNLIEKITMLRVNSLRISGTLITHRVPVVIYF